ncbi:hypothetical protein CF95_gp097 [Erwinia phage PhiEaH1]|uniref:Uncharacterized protein n=1 Tax=Erwinia phage PhiEaH1 TaxID=1401669 RepID=W8D060_9CAUD|nr:hypothetical protein CF95_gp097 [Erwinia phage PhiEaH1]AGX01819.1 hypothetical protein [Erwinia phage PhiEaH1]
MLIRRKVAPSQFTLTPCPDCNSTNLQILGSYKQGEFRIRCRHCGHRGRNSHTLLSGILNWVSPWRDDLRHALISPFTARDILKKNLSEFQGKVDIRPDYLTSLNATIVRVFTAGAVYIAVYYVTPDGGDGFAVFVPGDYGTLGTLVGTFTDGGYQTIVENPLLDQEVFLEFLKVVRRVIREIMISQLTEGK